MCVILFKSQNCALPSKKEIKSMWNTNPDGAGIMWQKNNGKVNFIKGFMSCKKLIKHLFSNQEELVKAKVAIHFRITTHGGTSEGNTHPFVADMNVSPHLLSGTANYVLMHNGMLTVKPREKNISDSAELALRAGSYENPRYFLEQINDLVDDNKIILFVKGEEPLFIGDWEEKDGFIYSNLNHDFIKPSKKYPYNYYDYDFKYDYDNYKANYYNGDSYYEDGYNKADDSKYYEASFDWGQMEWVDVCTGEIIFEDDLQYYTTFEEDAFILDEMRKNPQTWRERISFQGITPEESLAWRNIK